MGSNPVRSTSLSLCSSVWLERLIWDQEAAGSNPAMETIRFVGEVGYHVCLSRRRTGVRISYESPIK